MPGCSGGGRGWCWSHSWRCRARHAAFEQHYALADLGEIGEQFLALLVEHLGSDRDFDHQVLGAGPGAVLAHAMATALGPEVLGVTEIDQRIEARHRDHPHVAALAAVPAVRPAVLDELLAPEADRARPAGARAEMNLGLSKVMCQASTGETRGIRTPDSSLRTTPLPLSYGPVQVDARPPARRAWALAKGPRAWSD